MSDLSKIVDKATDAIVNGQTLSTDNLNDLAKIFYASANRIIEAIDKSAGLHREIVQQLPTQDIDDNTIYMVLDSSASGSDIYDEWMWIENAWEHIGSTRVDLTDYYNKTQVDTALNGKADTATSLAGYGIIDAYTKTEVNTALSGKANTSDIPTTLASLSDDATHRVVTDTEKTAWNGKSNFSGNYNDLSNKPTIPDVIMETITASIGNIEADSFEVVEFNSKKEGYYTLGIVGIRFSSSPLSGVAISNFGIIGRTSTEKARITVSNNTSKKKYLNNYLYVDILYKNL